VVDVAFFLPNLGGGGAERAILLLSKGLSESGLKVELILSSADGEYLDDVSDKVSIVNLKSRRTLLSLFSLARHVHVSRPKVLFSALSHANLIALIACKVFPSKTKLIVSERSNLSSALRNSDYKEKIVAIGMRLLYWKADKILAVSNGVADDLAGHISCDRSKIDVLYNPVEVPTSGESIDLVCPASFRAGLSSGESIILGVGRLTQQKNFALLIRAFAMVRSVRPCKLVILGDGELSRDLIEIAESLDILEDVYMPGFSRDPFTWMKLADVFVLSSDWEGLPNVLIQAMACGTPVVSTDCKSGPAEILEDGKWGRMVPTNDPYRMSLAILEALDDKNHPDARLRAADFSVEVAVRRLLDFIKPYLLK
jgi:glycosyltransferase involved in cell wall biosynthesis